MFAVNDDIALCCPAMIMIMSDVCHGGIFCHIQYLDLVWLKEFNKEDSTTTNV